MLLFIVIMLISLLFKCFIDLLLGIIEEILSYVPSDSPTCTVCGQKFFNKSSLRRHLDRHIIPNRKRFQCDVCHKYFSRKDYVREHKQHLHGIMSK